MTKFPLIPLILCATTAVGIVAYQNYNNEENTTTNIKDKQPPKLKQQVTPALSAETIQTTKTPELAPIATHKSAPQIAKKTTVNNARRAPQQAPSRGSQSIMQPPRSAPSAPPNHLLQQDQPITAPVSIAPSRPTS